MKVCATQSCLLPDILYNIRINIALAFIICYVINDLCTIFMYIFVFADICDKNIPSISIL